jgi:hypothetical protein
LIAGTGRSGTTLLVRYLTQLGMDTRLSRHGEAGSWNDEANAGLEDLPLRGTAGTGHLPYVIKTPWAFEVVQDIVQNPDVRLDAVILPMRDIVEAAASRTVLEMRSMYEAAPWMSELSSRWETWAQTPGGLIYSLNPVDQARLLALGFHQVVHQLASAGVPMIFLTFPRMVEDADYLYSQLKPVLPADITLEAARAAHAAVVDLKKVRVGAELSRELEQVVGCLNGPSMAELDRIALLRELERVNRRCAELDASLAEARKEKPTALQRCARALRKAFRFDASPNSLAGDR